MRLGIASPPQNLKTRYDNPPAILQLARAERGPIKCGLLERRPDGRVVTYRYPRASEVADQVPDDIYLVNIVVREFHGRELSFNLND